MLRLRIRKSDETTTLPGRVTVKPGFSKFGAVSVTSGESGVVFSGFAMKWSDWYALFTRTKVNAMLHGGEVLNQVFSGGLEKVYYKDNALMTVNGCFPDDAGELRIIGDANVQLLPTATGLELSVFKSGIDKVKLLEDITRLVWRLYHAVNYLSKRVRVFDPLNYTEAPLGRCFGTLAEQQAQVCRWNHYVWMSSYVHMFEPCNERLAFALGYTATDCDVDMVKVVCTITVKNDSIPDDVAEAIAALTIFKMGKSGNLGELPDSKATNPLISTRLTKTLVGGSTVAVSGTGKDPKMYQWKSITIVLTLPAMIAGEQYMESFALAVGTGGESSLDIPDGDDGARIKLDAEVVWEIDRGGLVETRTKLIEGLSIIAVNATKIETSESDDV